MFLAVHLLSLLDCVFVWMSSLLWYECMYIALVISADIDKRESWTTCVCKITACCRVIPESPRWLLSKNREVEAEDIIRHAARVNEAQLPPKLFDGKNRRIAVGSRPRVSLSHIPPSLNLITSLTLPPLCSGMRAGSYVILFRLSHKLSFCSLTRVAKCFFFFVGM